MDITELMNLYEGGGTSAYHPRMLLKVLLYAYCIKIYTGRKIARALGQDIHFFWLSGMSRPDFRTVNNFRSSKAKEVIEVLLSSMLVFLMEHKYQYNTSWYATPLLISHLFSLFFLRAFL
jgi:transposase